MSAWRIGSVCTGYGGLDIAVQQVFGGSLAWVADNDPGAARILAHHHPEVINLGDITVADWCEVEPVDIYIGGYPCQPFSTAGRRKGTEDARHIWPHIARALGVLRPRYAIFENVANHLRLGFDTVLCDLADLGFDVEWCVVRADQVGACHQRRRLIVLATAADAPRPRRQGEGIRGSVAERGDAAADAADLGHQRNRRARGGRPGPSDGRFPAADAARVGRGEGRPEPTRQQGRPGATVGGAPDWGEYAPAVARWEAVTGRRAPWATDDRGRLSPAFVEWMMGLEAGHVTAVPGLSRTAQLKALGNGVVPLQAAVALRLLRSRAKAGTRGVAA
ncbi:DNA cytosine methyltransferase [Streptomyces lycii]|uniref:DNA (cytosine-5-)-methyltransferase n=1 Tax=Streptomyces lycii TaxID=2654337 RepID=A0ABQ7FJF8_9ACTN|nr:DNA cytosine methyltransferase [Streptomyces lycii]KAF4408753.1 DNA cytosine methyltransferase [Streptomyces lycii]